MTLSDQTQGNADAGCRSIPDPLPLETSAPAMFSVTAVGSNIPGNYAAEINWSKVQQQLDQPSRSNKLSAPRGGDICLPVDAAKDILLTDAAY